MRYLPPINVGVIGCGGISLHHLQRLQQIPDVHVTVACDIDPVALTRFSLEAKIPKRRRYRRFQSVLRIQELDAVLICLPNYLHAPVSISAMEAGKDVFCEKPMATSYIEAKQMVATSKRTKQMLFIGLQNRFRTEAQALKRRVEADDLGQIYYAKCRYLRRSGIPGWGSWFTQHALAGSGPLYDIGVHVLDLACWFMSNFQPATAYAVSYAKFGPRQEGLGGWGAHDLMGIFDVEDFTTALLRMENGATISLDVSWASHIDQSDFSLQVLGDQAGFDLESATLFTREYNDEIDKHLQLTRRDPHLLELKHFIECLQGHKTPLIRLDEMLGLQKALEMISRSSRENRLVSAIELNDPSYAPV